MKKSQIGTADERDRPMALWEPITSPQDVLAVPQGPPTSTEVSESTFSSHPGGRRICALEPSHAASCRILSYLPGAFLQYV